MHLNVQKTLFIMVMEFVLILPPLLQLLLRKLPLLIVWLIFFSPQIHNIIIFLYLGKNECVFNFKNSTQQEIYCSNKVFKSKYPCCCPPLINPQKISTTTKTTGNYPVPAYYCSNGCPFKFQSLNHQLVFCNYNYLF